MKDEEQSLYCLNYKGAYKPFRVIVENTMKNVIQKARKKLKK